MNQGVEPGKRPLPADLAAAVELGGEMGRRFLEFDWAAHPLGRPHDWPPEVRGAVAVTLTSRFPMAMFLSAPGLFQLYNDAFVPILGDKHPAALGRPGRDVWEDVWESVGPMLTGVTDTGTAIWSNDLMVPLVTENRPQERYFTFSYSPLIAPGGEVTGVFCAVTETTERVLSERRLHLLNSVASAVMEAQTVDHAVTAALAVMATQSADLPFVAVYVDDGTSAHDSVLHGATPAMSGLLPRKLSRLMTWDARREMLVVDDLATVIPGITTAFGDNCPRQALVVPLREGLTAGALPIGINPLSPLDSLYRGFCQLLADQLSSAFASAVSYEQQRHRGDALAELDRAKSAFLTNVSHEFRTPLTLLLGPLDDALSDAGPNTVLADRLTTARRNALRLLRLVDSLLTFSRIEAGRATAALVCVDVGALTSEIASTFSQLCERAGLDLVIDWDSALADVDPGMWETIVLNLLSNAVKYTVRGSISVEVRSEPEHCRIALSDTGVGIAARDLDRISERFYRADSARGRSVEGSGIGLSLVHGLVELQRGTLQIESELDRGTTVTIRLPRSLDGTPIGHAVSGPLDDTNPYVAEAAQWLTPSPVDRQSGAAPPEERRRQLVLIADDNADMRAHLDRVLSPHWDTVLVADGQSALDATRDLQPDAVVADVMMPALDGFQFVAALRAEPAVAATPVVMLSARAGAEEVSEGFAGGVDDYLPKPFRSQDLVDRVAARLAAAGRERAGQQQRDADLRKLSELGAALHSGDSVEAILAILLDAPVGIADAAAVAIGVLDADRENVRFEYGGAVPAELRDRYHVATLDTPLVAVDVIKSGKQMVVPDTLELSPRYGHSVHDSAGSVRSCVYLPLRGNLGRIIGVLVLFWPVPRHFEAAELDLFARTAEMTQSALDRVRLNAREHRIAVEFQEQLLDLDRGSTAAVVAALYQPAGETMRVGGDWYLVTPLNRPGEIGICVGDVVGHGLPAAIAMSRLRAAVAATALTNPDPAAVLGAIDTYAATVSGARFATVAYALVAAGDGSAVITYSCAGHPYPLVVFPDGRPAFLESGRRLPVATMKNVDRSADSAGGSTAQAELPPGSLIVLYTDGLVERPGESLDDGFARLKEAAAACADLPVDTVCSELLERMTPPQGYHDDVVVLVLRPSHAGPHSITTVLPAAATEVPVARARLQDWLTAIAVDPQRALDILLATGEAVTNAIEHGSRNDPRRTISIEAFVRGDAVAVTVADSGQWLGDSSASQRSYQRGRGLTMMSGLANRVDTLRGRGGTRVRLQFDHAVGTEQDLG